MEGAGGKSRPRVNGQSGTQEDPLVCSLLSPSPPPSHWELWGTVTGQHAGNASPVKTWLQLSYSFTSIK